MGEFNNREINESELINNRLNKQSEVSTKMAKEQDHEQLVPKEMTDTDDLDEDIDEKNELVTDLHDDPDDPKAIEDFETPEDNQNQEEVDDANNSKIINCSEENKNHDDPKCIEDAENEEINNRITTENKKPVGDIVFEGMTIENPQYGEGGGKQYFIRDFGNMIQDGRMTKIGEENLKYTGQLSEDEKPKAEIEKQKYKYNYVLDTSPLTDEEKAEWAQLDEETRDEQGLSRVMPNMESQIIEDRTNPWNDQENSSGSFYPDSYSNPRELQGGEYYYQLRPVNAKYDSPYVTDKETVDACRNENGDVDVGKMLQKLQVKPSSVREYTLSQYIYQPGEASNKVRK